MKVYLSGTSSGRRNWREDIVSSSTLLSPNYKEYRDAGLHFWVPAEKAILDTLDYTGPFFNKTKDECARIALAAIEEADLVFAWVEQEHDLPIVASEIGYASALGKLVWISFPPEDELDISDSIWKDHLSTFATLSFVHRPGLEIDRRNSLEEFLLCLQSLFPFLPTDHRETLKQSAKTNKMLSHQKMNRFGYIYVIRAETGHYKIGRSGNVPQRMKLFTVKLPFDFEIIHVFSTNDMYRMEVTLHKMFEADRVNGEWFNLAQEDVERLKTLNGTEEEFERDGAYMIFTN